ncbi:MAG: GAF domain-containing protein [Armatimonadota bacterium]
MSQSDNSVVNAAELFSAATRAAADILASSTGVEALEHLADTACKIVGARYAAIGVANADGTALDEFVVSGMTEESQRMIPEKPKGIGVLGLLIHRQSPLRLDDIKSHAASVGFPPNHPPMTSFLGVPLCHGGICLGSLYLTDKQGGFSAQDEVSVDALRLQLCVGIRNLQMLRRQQALSQRLLTAQEEERKATAADLHDSLTQLVFAARAHLDAYRARESASPDHDLDLATKYLRDAGIECRTLIKRMRVLELEDLGFVAAIGQLVDEEQARAGWDSTNFTTNVQDDDLHPMLSVSIYRLVQEALNNIRKHASATAVDVLVEQVCENDRISVNLIVIDNGLGFDVNAVHQSFEHIGLQNMRERTQLFGGSFRIESETGNGTTICIRLFPDSIPTTLDKSVR